MENLHILILEDDDRVSRMYEKILQYNGYYTSRTSTVEDALGALHTFDPDIICLDWQLEHGTSAPFLDYLAKIPPPQVPKVLLVSANVRKIDLAKYAPLIADVMHKPVSLGYFVKAIQSLARDQVRQPLSTINIEQLAPATVLMCWQGRISRALIHQTMQDALYAAQVVILDFRKLTLLSSDLVAFVAQGHPPLPNLQRILVVQASDRPLDTQYLLSILSADIECQYFDDVEAAKVAALGA